MKRVPTYVSPEASHFPEVGLKEHPSAPQPSGPPPTPKRSQPVPSARPPPSSHSPPASQCVGIVTSPSPPGPQGRQMCLSSILRLRLTGSRDTGGGGAILHQGLAPQPASRPGCAEGDKLETTHSLEMPPPATPPPGGLGHLITEGRSLSPWAEPSTEVSLSTSKNRFWILGGGSLH